MFQSEEFTPEPKETNYKSDTRTLADLPAVAGVANNTRSKAPPGVVFDNPIVVSPDGVLGSSLALPIHVPPDTPFHGFTWHNDNFVAPPGFETPPGVFPFVSSDGSVGSESPYSSPYYGKFCCFSIYIGMASCFSSFSIGWFGFVTCRERDR